MLDNYEKNFTWKNFSYLEIYIHTWMTMAAWILTSVKISSNIGNTVESKDGITVSTSILWEDYRICMQTKGSLGNQNSVLFYGKQFNAYF